MYLVGTQAVQDDSASVVRMLDGLEAATWANKEQLKRCLLHDHAAALVRHPDSAALSEDMAGKQHMYQDMLLAKNKARSSVLRRPMCVRANAISCARDVLPLMRTL
jgi:hypothetical protein